MSPAGLRALRKAESFIYKPESAFSYFEKLDTSSLNSHDKQLLGVMALKACCYSWDKSILEDNRIPNRHVSSEAEKIIKKYGLKLDHKKYKDLPSLRVAILEKILLAFLKARFIA